MKRTSSSDCSSARSDSASTVVGKQVAESTVKPSVGEAQDHIPGDGGSYGQNLSYRWLSVPGAVEKGER